MYDVIKTFYDYNTWATGQLIEAMKALSPEEYATVEASGHGPIRDTFAHFLSVQWGWFSWFDGSLPSAEAIARAVSAEEIDTVEQAEARWHAIDEQTRTCIDRLDDEKLRDVWSWELPWSTGALPLSQLIFHVANHQTHTRSQIVAAIRRAGHDPGVYEFLFYTLAQAEASQ